MAGKIFQKHIQMHSNCKVQDLLSLCCCNVEQNYLCFVTAQKNKTVAGMDGIGQPRLNKTSRGRGISPLGGTGDSTGSISSSREVLQVTGVHRIPFSAAFTVLLQAEQTCSEESHTWKLGTNPIPGPSGASGSPTFGILARIYTFVD